MRRSMAWVGPIFAAVVLSIQLMATSTPADQGSKKSDWTIPAGGENEKNPLVVNDAILAAGRKVFVSKCQRCHGRQGRGDGPDADKKHLDHMNLTNPANAHHNSDGTVFYKIWNGRSSPKMPRFSEELTKEQAWAVAAYVQTLRLKS